MLPEPTRALADGDERWSPARAFAAWLVAVVSVGLLFFTYRHLEGVVAGSRHSWLEPFLSEMSAVATTGVLFFAVRLLVGHRPLGRGGLGRRLPLYFGAMLLFAVLHTSMMWGSREVLFRLAGLGDYDYGRMPLRYLMELPMQVLSFWILVGALLVVRDRREARRRELRTARLEAALAGAELRNLRLQLQPHFLFNALNTISATMYDDPRAADEMLDRLAELLRAWLRTARTDCVPLGEELRILELYLGLLRARWGERLEVRREIERGLHGLEVPSGLLQPLVENAVRHGNAEREGRGRIVLRARRRDGLLVLEVEDDGTGVDPEAEPLAGSGIGLSSTAERVRLLYGERGRVEAGNVAGGFRVRIELPAAAAGPGSGDAAGGAEAGGPDEGSGTRESEQAAPAVRPGAVA